MKYLVFTVFCFHFIGVQTAVSQSNIITESKFTFNSSILDEERTCLISLPHSYNDSTEVDKKYPIIILLDGAAHFKAAAGIVHFMSSDRNRNYLMPKAIIIAIENVDRERDFTVTKLKTKRPNTMGGGRNFLSFIEKELIPHIDKNYRTEPYKILVGHSLGGQLALNSYMDDKSIFNGYIAIDPSLWWDEQLISKKVDSILPLSFKKKLYIATANLGEAKYERNKKRHDTFYALLKKRAGESLKAKIDYFENENHRSVPLVAIYEGLKYLYDNEKQ